MSNCIWILYFVCVTYEENETNGREYGGNEKELAIGNMGDKEAADDGSNKHADGHESQVATQSIPLPFRRSHVRGYRHGKLMKGPCGDDLVKG